MKTCPSKLGSPSLPAQLEDQLNAYETSSNAVNALRGNGRPNWGVYATVAASSLAAATSADAQILYSGPQNVTVTLPPFVDSGLGLRHSVTQQINIGGSIFTIGLEEYLHFGNHYGQAFIRAQGNGAVLPVAYHAFGYNLAANLKTGSRVTFDGQTMAKDAYLHVQNSFDPQGVFEPGVPGFVELNLGSFDRGSERLGWLRVSFKNGAGGYPDSITAIDWAEQQHFFGGFTAGETPEPSVSWLMVLGTGAVGVAAWKRRRETLVRKTETAAASN